MTPSPDRADQVVAAVELDQIRRFDIIVPPGMKEGRAKLKLIFGCFVNQGYAAPSNDGPVVDTCRDQKIDLAVIVEAERVSNWGLASARRMCTIINAFTQLWDT